MKTTQICLHDIFENAVDKTPDKTALICRDMSLPYQEVDQRANELAHYIRSKGVSTGDLVGVYFNRSERPIIALLAILKTGAGYVPLDPAYPIERMRHIADDAAISLLLTEESLLSTVESFYTGAVVAVDIDHSDIVLQSNKRLDREAIGLTPNHLSYVIYTSGTTGRPKGVMTEHHNVVEFVDSFKDVCQLNAEDKVYQGFSLGFDGSVEEMWMCFSSGATLVVGTPEIIQFGSEVAKLINKEEITFFSTVPTFLSMVKDELPTVRVLIVSGEQCPKELVNQWARPGRRMLNVYGPTEATVNTTVAECAPEKPITIGTPINGYSTFLLDDKMNPVPSGQSGELFIGGVGVARGFLNQPELTKKHFVNNPFNGKSKNCKLYRTGDLVRQNTEGDLEFLGRIDTQVKVRGFRIELSEIESVLREHDQINQAVVTVYNHDALQELAAFVTLEKGKEEFETNSVLSLLQKRLPHYMVPRYCDVMDALPLLTSGKIDRKSLPTPSTPLVRSDRDVTVPKSTFEEQMLAFWEDIFNLSPISVADDFFLDLGGDSLMAAQLVTVLRKELSIEAAMRDVYQHATIRKLCKFLESRKSKDSDTEKKKNRITPSSKEIFKRQSPFVRLGCSLLQVFSLFGLYGFVTLPVSIILVLYFSYSYENISLIWFVGLSAAVALFFYPLILLTSIGVKWLVIGKYKAGSYPLWGMYYLRWWIVTRMQKFSGVGLLAGTPMLPLYYRLMGAKIGKQVAIHSNQCFIFDLLTIGDKTCVGAESQLLGYRVEDGMLHMGSITIGNRCFMGISATMGINSTMHDDSRLDDLSFLPDGEIMQECEQRKGSPARPARVSLPDFSAEGKDRHRPILFSLLHVIALLGIELFLLLVAIPSIALILVAYNLESTWFWVITVLLLIPLYEISFCIGSVLCKYLLVPKVKPGVYSLESLFYVRKWTFDTILSISRLIILPVYTTLYFIPWVRALGAKVGKNAEFSVVAQFSPDLLTAGEGSFFADGSIIGGMRVFNGQFQLARNTIGSRTFVGNSATIPVGSGLGDNCLVGVLSTPPDYDNPAPDTTEWLGSPSFQLPHRKKVEGFSETATYKPTVKLYLLRLIVDALRIAIPSTIEIGAIFGFISLMFLAYLYLPTPMLFLVAPVLSFVIAMTMALSVVVVKSVIMGRYTPTIKPLWSIYVWLNEVINGAYEAIAAPAITPLLGTPFVAWFLRLLGCKIGKHTFIETTLFGEFDLVEVGDYVALNVDVVIQNHLFEDRIMKASHLKIGDECSLGNMAIILYDAEMKAGSKLSSLSLLMKGETVQPDTAWIGIPVEPMKKKNLDLSQVIKSNTDKTPHTVGS